MSDPSLFVSNPTRSDPSLAPHGREVYYVLAPAPTSPWASYDWRGGLRRRYADEPDRDAGDARLRRVRPTPSRSSHVVTPADWAAAGMAAGTPFASAHTFAQTGPFRPATLHPALPNVVFVGVGHAARRRRADGADLREARRPAHHGGIT